MSAGVPPLPERPPLPDLDAVGDDGVAFTYGRRWDDGPADDAYSHVSHPERFAGLHDVGRALVAHVVDTYEVEATPVDRLGPPDGDGQRLVEGWRLSPGPRRGSLTIGLSDFPGVLTATGSAVTEGFPACGCDACDESAEATAERLEDAVARAVRGWPRRSVGEAGRAS